MLWVYKHIKNQLQKKMVFQLKLKLLLKLPNNTIKLSNQYILSNFIIKTNLIKVTHSHTNSRCNGNAFKRAQLGYIHPLSFVFDPANLATPWNLPLPVRDLTPIFNWIWWSNKQQACKSEINQLHCDSMLMWRVMIFEWKFLLIFKARRFNAFQFYFKFVADIKSKSFSHLITLKIQLLNFKYLQLTFRIYLKLY